MKPWKKEALVCLGGGALIVALLFGTGAAIGGKMGPCDPIYGGAWFSVAAVLPGLPLMAVMPDWLADGYAGSAIVFTAAVIGYAGLVLLVRRLGRSVVRSINPRP